MTRPLLVYDDDCGFCTWCARVARRHGDVDVVGFSDLEADTEARLPEDWRNSAHLVGDDVVSGGEAIEQTLARFNPVFRAVFSVLRSVPGYPRLREWLYRWGADRRDWWGRIVAADDA